jgi:3-phenylpropionate/trans-cinnamate dioxygenase ferredoxin subunit
MLRHSASTTTRTSLRAREQCQYRCSSAGQGVAGFAAVSEHRRLGQAHRAKPTMTWVRAAKVTEISDGEAIVVERKPEPPVALFKVAGDFYAIDDTCTHDKYSLADGYIEDEIVECPLHTAKFSIRTGDVLSPPATKNLQTYPVKVELDVVYVDL